MHRRLAVVFCAWAVVAVALSGLADEPAQRMDRSKLLIGAYRYNPVGYDEAHVREVAECGVDFIVGVDPYERKVLDLFAKYGLGAFAYRVFDDWNGGHGENAGQMRSLRPKEKYEEQIRQYLADLDHPAIWKMKLADEPNARDMAYIGEIAELVRARSPHAQTYVNLYPNYAMLAKNSKAEELSQLGTSTYREYIDTYCRTVPLDYISYDFYVYAPNEKHRLRLLDQMYDNFDCVAEACRKTGRSFWYIPQVNSYKVKVGEFEPTSVNRLRFQAYTAMAYGAEVISWACWMPGWWTNNVYTASGEKTAQYDKLKKVNAELKRLGPEYMRFRNLATSRIGGAFGGDDYRSEAFSSVRARESTALVIGEMRPRGADNGERALFVVASGDPFDLRPASRHVVVALPAGRRVRILGPDGEILPQKSDDGTYAFPLAECSAALLVSGVVRE